MKKIILFAAILLTFTIVMVPTAFAAENTKSGVVDYIAVINESDAGKKANAELTEFVKGKQEILQGKEKKIQELKKNFEEQQAKLSAEEKKAKEEEFVRLVRDFQVTQAESNAEIQKKTIDLRNGVLKEIKEVVDKIAQEENYSMILNAEVVPYYVKSIDLTAKVIEKYNAAKRNK